MSQTDDVDDAAKDERSDAATRGGGYVSTNPNDAAAEHESMAVADSDHEQDPGSQPGGS